jgi:RNA polymerase sigma-70 factor, ECF subfamily
MIERRLLERLHRKAKCARWSIPLDLFREALERGVARVFSDAAPSSRDLERYLDGLHLEDLALACACSIGNEEAWEHLILEHRPVLYRAADALDASGGAREVADSLYAELYGVRATGDDCRSLFRYFHGRSSLATWLRAILAQRWVDRIRLERRSLALDEEQLVSIPERPKDPDAQRFAALVRDALHAAVARLESRDRLRLRSYYEQDLTLAQIGRITGEHEATVSRHLARTRKVLRVDVEASLRQHSRLTEGEIARCLESAMDDAGMLDMAELFRGDTARKNDAVERSE